LLLAAVGQLPLASGDVRIFGKPVSARQPSRVARLGVATVPDDRGLFLQLSVADNLRLVHPRRTSLDEVFSTFPALSKLMGRKCGLLSGGEQQMLALAKALLSQPRLLVIDEMSHGLAPMIAERLLGTVRQLADQHGVAVLLVEQHVHLALAVAHRAMVLRGGNVALTGTAAELSACPERVQLAYLGARTSRSCGMSPGLEMARRSARGIARPDEL
jgi:branched-chain amino acid transport system ATP-binding protein